MKLRFLLLSALLAVGLWGCATIMQGTSQKVNLYSTPSGAAIFVDGQELGRTPMVAQLKRKDNHMVRFELVGYHPHETILTRNISGWVWGNIFLGGFIGLAIDFGTGGLYNLTPEQMTATLEEAGISTAPQEGALQVAVVLHADPSWKRIDTLTAIDYTSLP